MGDDLQAQRMSDQTGPRLAEIERRLAEIERVLNELDRRTAVQSIPEYLPWQSSR